MIYPISWAHAAPYLGTAFALAYLLARSVRPDSHAPRRARGYPRDRLGQYRRDQRAQDGIEASRRADPAAGRRQGRGRGADRGVLGSRHGHRRGARRAGRPPVPGVAAVPGRQGRGDRARHPARPVWPAGALACLTWLAISGVTRYSSLSALAAFGLAPVYLWQLADPQKMEFSILMAVLVWLRHAGNIRRLLAGTEPRIGGGGG